MTHPTIIEMYNGSNYSSWEDAKNSGAIYRSTVYSVDEPEYMVGRSIIADVIAAALQAARMVDSGVQIYTRIAGESESME